VIRALLRSPYRVRSLLLTELRWRALAAELEHIDAPVYIAAQAVVNEVSGFALHRGALASADRLPLAEPEELCRDAALVVVTEGINDHENLGALFRNAAAFGADAVLLDPTSCDPLYRRAVRVSMGHVLRVPFTRIDGGPTGIARLQRLGFEVVALTPSGAADDIGALRGSDRVRRALLVGAEGPGLAAATLAAADRRVRISMAPGVDSLNVATAAAIALHELAPARNHPPAPGVS
jgi:tRNA G18 (ribose-2'-O)-methylase SpoU